MPNSIRFNIYKNIPNIVSILGVLPLIALFTEEGYAYLIPLIIYNNIMDDVDGILAGKLNVRSAFGARLDNVCDAISHTIIIMVIGMHYGWVCGLIGLVAVSAVLVRSVSRLDPDIAKGTGSPTNELIRHILFVILLAGIFDFNPTLSLMAMFVTHAITMFIKYPMPYMIRSQTKSATAILFVNVSLIVAWLIPYTTPIIAGGFILTYLYSLLKIVFPKKINADKV